MANIPKKPKKPNHTDPSSLDYTPPPRDAPPVANDSYNPATQVQENPWDFWGEMAQAILSVGDVASKLSDSDTFKNPFDMDGAFAQQFLNTDKLFNKEKPKEEDKNMISYQKPDEKYFYSATQGIGQVTGFWQLKRYYQALYYKQQGLIKDVNGNKVFNMDIDAYGMECNASCVMYMLQSYGLIPPDLMRKEFEQIFTGLTPIFDRHSPVPEHIDDKGNNIRKKGTTEAYKVRYIDNIGRQHLLTPRPNIVRGVKNINDPDGFFRGIHGVPPINAINPDEESSHEQMNQIFKNFTDYRIAQGFDIFLSYRMQINKNRFNFKNKYKELQQGNLTSIDLYKYPIMTGIYLDTDNGTGHFCVIVARSDPKTLSINNMYQGIEKKYTFQIYWADDPLHGAIRVCVPIQDGINGTELFNAVQALTSTYGKTEKDIFRAISPKSAIGE